jgi:hypothetical protein
MFKLWCLLSIFCFQVFASAEKSTSVQTKSMDVNFLVIKDRPQMASTLVPVEESNPKFVHSNGSVVENSAKLSESCHSAILPDSLNHSLASKYLIFDVRVFNRSYGARYVLMLFAANKYEEFRKLNQIGSEEEFNKLNPQFIVVVCDSLKKFNNKEELFSFVQTHYGQAVGLEKETVEYTAQEQESEEDSEE